MQEQRIELEGGEWTVYVFDDGAMLIVDAEGRSRHTSTDHATTATHLAIALAKMPFESFSNADIAMRMHAEKFIQQHSRSS